MLIVIVKAFNEEKIIYICKATFIKKIAFP